MRQIGNRESPHYLPGTCFSKTEHQFIQYRGFTYEFAPRYGVQILDVNDPDYKYLNQRNITRNGIQNVGHSYCTWLDTTLFAERWQKGNHNIFTRKCEKFPTALLWYLIHGICSTHRIQPKRQNHYGLLICQRLQPCLLL